MSEALFTPYSLANVNLENRFVMAPMTRSRAKQPGDIPTELNATYYAQRASVGLIISEATQVSLQGMGYANTPGIYTQEQIEGWKKVTQAVHDAGSKMFLQLWHVGRVSTSQVNGLQPIAPSPCIAKDTNVYIFDGAPNGDVTFVDVEEPRAMTEADIQQVTEEFRTAANNAIAAGFDGVEIHGANGYLIDQFLRSNCNKRTDDYGGSQLKRTRFLIEITKAVVNAVGKEKTGVRLSPYIRFKDMGDPEILDTFMLAAEQLNQLDIAYLHLCEADWDDAPEVPESFRKELRQKFSNTIIATGNYTPKRGNEVINKQLVDLVGFGRKILANPDYPMRVAHNAPLNEITNTHTLFGGGTAEGYTDYPFYTELTE
ncbi:MAG: alkene reductase [Methylococcales bacterium]